MILAPGLDPGPCSRPHDGPMTKTSLLRTVLFSTLSAALFPVAAQEHVHPPAHAVAPEHVHPPAHEATQDPHAMHGAAAGHAMPGGLHGDYPMSRDASGTSWQPDATPMEGVHFSRGDWSGMLHGFVLAASGDAEGPRGGRDSYVESMFMAMSQRPLAGGTFGVRAMASLDPWTLDKDGYGLLLQTGETADGHEHLVDRQHPHDALMELAATWSRPLGADDSVFVYAGLPGEPALGPPAFMHRFSGLDNPEAPLGHHWLDATHITFGVVTAGWVHRDFKLEASAFNGREPDQHRKDIELRRLDSWSARATWNPDAHWSLQLSHGFLDSPEQLSPEVSVTRTTASAMHHRALADGRVQWQSTLAWGRNRKDDAPASDAWLLESALAWENGWTVFGRAERDDKDELFDHHDPLHGIPFTVSKLTLGAVHDFPRIGNGRLGVGAQASRHWLPAALEPSYGGDPSSWLVFVRWKLSGTPMSH